MAIIDKRRTDLRSLRLNTQSPLWIKSAVVDKSCVGKEAVLLSFPKGSQLSAGVYSIHAAAFKVEEAFDGAASITVGLGTIATDDVTTGGAIAVVDADQLLISADITEATEGVYGQSGSQFATDLGAGKQTFIVSADATVPIVYLEIGGAPTTGSGRVLLLISRVD